MVVVCLALGLLMQGQLPSDSEPFGVSPAHPGLSSTPPALGTQHPALVVERA